MAFTDLLLQTGRVSPRTSTRGDNSVSRASPNSAASSPSHSSPRHSLSDAAGPRSGNTPNLNPKPAIHNPPGLDPGTINTAINPAINSSVGPSTHNPATAGMLNRNEYGVEVIGESAVVPNPRDGAAGGRSSVGIFGGGLVTALPEKLGGRSTADSMPVHAPRFVFSVIFLFQNFYTISDPHGPQIFTRGSCLTKNYLLYL